MLKKLIIENFRGFARLETPELTRFNIVGGENDVGKSSLLEAVFLLSGMGRSDMATYLNRGRLMEAAKEEDLLSVFHGQDIHQTVKVTGMFGEGIIREVKLSGRLAGEREFREYVDADGPGDARLAPALVQSFRLVQDEREVEVGDLPLLVDGKGKLRKFSRTGMNHRWPCIYVPARTCLTGSLHLKEMVNRKRLGALVEVLHAIDSRIVDLTVNGDKVMVDIGLPGTLLPLQALGDGVVRTVDVLATADACRGGTVCIDEIENGLHHTAMRTFWRALLRFAHEGDVQVIASTHNLELMQHIAAEPAEEGTGDLTYIRMSSRGKSGNSLASFNVTDLKRAFAMGLDVRG